MTFAPRRALGCAAVLAAVAGLLPGVVGAARAEPTYDWLHFTVTAGPAGVANMRVDLTATGTLKGEMPYVFGIGTALDGRPRDLRAYNFGLGPRSISTSQGAGGIRMDIAPGKQLTAGYHNILFIGALGPGQVFSVVQFQTDAANEAPVVTTSIGSGAATVLVRNGSGSRVVTAGDPADGGVSANVDGTGAGSVVATRTATAGLVGAAVSHCNACRASWAAPDGRTGGLAMKGPEWAGHPAVGKVRTPEADVGRPGFAGPAGDWTFRWDGIDHVPGNNPAEIAYAPIGDAWTTFAGDPRPSESCAGGRPVAGVADVDNAAVRVRALVAQPSPDMTHVCVRAEDPVSHAGIGGRLVVTAGGSAGPGLPTADSDAGACATAEPPNGFPGPHPYLDMTVLGQPTELDVYRSGEVAMVCLSLGDAVATRITLPLPAGVPIVEFEPDPAPFSVG